LPRLAVPGEPVEGAQVTRVVTTPDRSLCDDGPTARSGGVSIAFAGFGSWLLATLAGWWVAGRSLAPARRALRQQREFIADAAHEMRTPLATIRASASQALLRDRDCLRTENR
jgi:signal transduction histidine kinase